MRGGRGAGDRPAVGSRGLAWPVGQGEGCGAAAAQGCAARGARLGCSPGPGVTWAAVLPLQVEEAGHVFLLMKKDYRISRNVRLAWVLSRLHQVIWAVPEPELVSWCPKAGWCHHGVMWPAGSVPLMSSWTLQNILTQFLSLILTLTQIDVLSPLNLFS